MGCGSSSHVAVVGKQLQPMHNHQKGTENKLIDTPYHTVSEYSAVQESSHLDDKGLNMSSINLSKEEINDFSKTKIDSSDPESKARPVDDSTLAANVLDESGADRPQLEEKKPKEPELTDDEKIAKLTEAIDHLNATTDFLSEEVKDDITFLHKRFSIETRNQNPNVNLRGIEYGLMELCLRVMKDLFNRDFFEDKKVWLRLKRILVVFWNGSDRFVEVCERLLKNDAHQYFLEVIQQPKIVDTDEGRVQIYARQVYTIKAVFGVIHNMLAKLGESGRIAFRELNAVGILQQQLEHKNTMIKIKAFINLAYLINEEENEIINADDKNIKYIVQILRDAVNSETRRSPKGFSAMETVEALNKLAVNDNNKERIHSSGALEYYEKLLVEGVTEDDQAMIIHGIWTLCFHPKVRDAINNNMSLISGLNEFRASENEKVRRFAKGVFWVLEGKHSQTNPVTTDSVQHIMISYNWGVKPQALQIRDQLLTAGFKVWMDVDNMTGSTLEAMADAVEKAAVVVVCMTRKYKESPSCRTEAEYTYQLRKPVIPLRLEKGYKADGWLGIMMGTKLWFDFVRNFQSAMSGLLRELKDRGKVDSPSDAPPVQGTPAVAVSSRKNPAYTTWSETQVTEWFKKIGLGHRTSKLTSMDGGLLHEFAEMKRDAPEFFYSSLRDDLNFSLIDILKFTKALAKL